MIWRGPASLAHLFDPLLVRHTTLAPIREVFSHPRRRAGPIGSAIAAEDGAGQHDQRQDDRLQRTRQEQHGLRPAMPPRGVRHIEQQRPIRRTAVEHVEHRLQIAIEVGDRRTSPATTSWSSPPFHQRCAEPAGNVAASPCRDLYLSSVDPRRERAGDDPARLGFLMMHVQRWALSMRRQRAPEREARLSIADEAPERQQFTGMTVLECQRVRRWLEW